MQEIGVTISYGRIVADKVPKIADAKAKGRIDGMKCNN
jgi:hypothetical protein